MGLTNQCLSQLQNIDQAQAAAGLSPEEQRRLRDYEEDPDSLDERDRQELERKLEGLPVKFERRLMEREIGQLEALTTLAESVKVDFKKDELLSFIESILSKDPKEKVLMFPASPCERC